MLAVFNQTNKARIRCGSISDSMRGRGKRKFCFITDVSPLTSFFLLNTCF